MKLDVKAELQKQLEEVAALDAQLQQLQAQRKALLEELFRKQGIIQYLQRLDATDKTLVEEKWLYHPFERLIPLESIS